VGTFRGGYVSGGGRLGVAHAQINGDRMKRSPVLSRLSTALVVTAIAGAGLSGCSSSSASAKTITIAYEVDGSFNQMDQLMHLAKTAYEKAHPGYTVDLEPIQAEENSYYTKLDLMNKSASTAPDVLYEDTFLVNSDIAAGYLTPIDSELAKWSDWNQFTSTAKGAGIGSDGHTYGVPMGTDTRGLWYNKKIFAEAGLPADWHPKNWNDILSAARTIKAKVPGVYPLNVYSGQGAGETATMQGFEMLLYGTGDTLYNSTTKKWVTSSPGMTSAMNFLNTVYSENLGVDVQDSLNSQIATTVANDLMPNGKLAIDLDGSFTTAAWTPKGTHPWPQYVTALGEAAMPTENGQAPGYTSMSGGWLMSVGARAKDPQAAFDFITLALNEQNSTIYDTSDSQIAVRKDVAADPKYLSSDPTTQFWTNLVQYTHYRPAYTAYPQVSNALQTATETVMTGQGSVSAALQQFSSTVQSAVGPGQTTSVH
jgi:multiple sugar transport system substrate-binding protein